MTPGIAALCAPGRFLIFAVGMCAGNNHMKAHPGKGLLTTQAYDHSESTGVGVLVGGEDFSYSVSKPPCSPRMAHNRFF